MAAAAAAEAVSVPARAQLGGREQLRAAPRPPPKLFRAAERVSELVPRCVWGRQYRPPLALHFCSCGDFFRILFFKTSLFAPNACRKDSGSRLCGGRSRGGASLRWLCRLPDRQLLEMPFPRGRTGVDVPLARRGPTRRRDRAALEHRPGVLRHPTAPGGQHSSQKLSQSGVSWLFVSYPPTSFMIFFSFSF